MLAIDPDNDTALQPRVNTKTRTIKKYGWIPDLPDHRDHCYAAPPLVKLPKKVDLRPNCPAVYDQGELGSCTANAIAAAHQFDQMKQKKTTAFAPSRLFIYYNERAIEGTVKVDSGAMLRDGIKSLADQGAAPETSWPYDILKFTNKPPKKCYDAGLKNQALSYQRLTPTLAQLQGCLATGYPFVFGFSVYDSFESAAVARTGKVPMPNGSTEKLLGGHAVLAAGYDETKQCFIVRNSWGADWGVKGYCTFPYAYLLDANLCNDFWTVRVVE
jgi:C1A family cysteine protease